MRLTVGSASEYPVISLQNCIAQFRDKPGTPIIVSAASRNSPASFQVCRTRISTVLRMSLKPSGKKVSRFLVRSLWSFAIALSLLGFALAASRTASSVPLQSIAVTHHLPLGLPPFKTTRFPDPAMVEYGEFLFQISLLSRDGSIACNSCHNSVQGLSGAVPTAIGIGGVVGHRHAPPLFNLYILNALMWDGRARNLDQQIHMPLESASEMAIDWRTSIDHLSSKPETKIALAKEGKGRWGERFIVSAIASYLHSLVTGGSAFDRYYYGGDESAISQDAKDGLTLFVRKGQCATCHLITGYAAPLTDSNFHSVGIGYSNGNYSDIGRLAVTGKESDRGLFKTPSLRNVAQRSYFMHDGSMKSLREVMAYYNRGGNRGAPNLDTRLRPLFLSDSEIEEIVTFLQTLDSPIESYRPVRSH